MFNSKRKISFSTLQAYANTSSVAVSKFMMATFAWMFVGLLCSAGSAFFILSSPTLTLWAFKSYLLLFLLQFGIVLILGLRFQHLSVTSARLLFLFYSILTGATLSLFAMIFTPGSIVLTLLATSAIFGVMSIYGYTTKEDLSKFKSLLMMGVIFIVIASLLNLLLHSSVLYYLVSYVGVIVFTALVGYDVNKIKILAMQSQGSDSGSLKKLAIFGALQLYLDFINLFIFLLQIFGRRNN